MKIAHKAKCLVLQAERHERTEKRVQLEYRRSIENQQFERSLGLDDSLPGKVDARNAALKDLFVIKNTRAKYKQSRTVNYHQRINRAQKALREALKKGAQ